MSIQQSGFELVHVDTYAALRSRGISTACGMHTHMHIWSTACETKYIYCPLKHHPTRLQKHPQHILIMGAKNRKRYPKRHSTRRTGLDRTGPDRKSSGEMMVIEVELVEGSVTIGWTEFHHLHLGSDSLTDTFCAHGLQLSDTETEAQLGPGHSKASGKVFDTPGQRIACMFDYRERPRLIRTPTPHDPTHCSSYYIL